MILNWSTNLRKIMRYVKWLKHTDIKIKKSFQNKLTPHSQNNFPFPRWPSLSISTSILTLHLLSCFEFGISISQKKNSRKKLKWREEDEQLRMLNSPGYLLTLPGLGGGERGGLVGPRLTFVVYIPRTKNVEALRLNDFS